MENQSKPIKTKKEKKVKTEQEKAQDWHKKLLSFPKLYGTHLAPETHTVFAGN